MRGKLQRLLTAAAVLAASACASLPAPQTTQERLAAFPRGGLGLERPVTIYWSQEQIPFIEAETDHDAAFALGLVHGHLRLGQIEVLRHISQGRISEVAGPFGELREVDRALRILDFGKTSHEVYINMPAETKAFLEAFVAGLNHYQGTVAELPHEYALMGIGRRPFRPEELLTLGRLASVDTSWMVWFRLMALRNHPDWQRIWARALEGGTASSPSFDFERNLALQQFNDILAGTGRVGSNSFALGGARTHSGAAIIASDPHLGTGLPNIWLLAGLKSPSFHMVGFMLPGLPCVAVGRNEDIAWGGTNLRSAASDLIDVSGLPADQITSREENLGVRWWRDETLTIRETPYGPIISDAPMLPKRDGEEFALKWIGHMPSDELTAMLDMNRARNWNEFRDYLEPFSISAQNFIYADRLGNVGQLTATHLPHRSPEPPADMVRPIADAQAWNTILTARDLPHSYNPAAGFVATANNKPAETPFPIGYFFSGNDRVLRLRDVLSQAHGATADDIRRLQDDTYMISAARLRDAIAARARTVPDLPGDARAMLELISSWDARFDAESKGAVAFQAAVATLVPYLADAVERAIIETGGSEFMEYAELIEAAPAGTLDAPIMAALAAARTAAETYPAWGDMHTLTLDHTFSNIPMIGERYRFGELPWPGSEGTIWRASHDLSTEKVGVDFGAQARHISDLSDPDSNWFALLGGNDGWFNSANFIDEIGPFRSGELIRVPMRLETVRETFPYRTVLGP